ncbi:MAG TPA: dihydrolipoyl dehydrogenase [Gammaproteobacteria bacterium]|nr:dihydrolipoyl dehydrogenase [Gammaproteobacteria bacterium]
MTKLTEVRLPDIGDFDTVEVIEVLVAAGDSVAQEDSLITLESDKATMEIPSPAAGTVAELKVSVGDKISENDLILMLDAEAGDSSAEHAEETPEAKAEADSAATQSAQASTASATNTSFEKGDKHAEVLVLGSGPGGYTAAFRAADLGRQVIMVERHERIGGVCLNVGCIPSKALLHTAAVINEADEMGEHGVSFGKPKIDIDKIRDWKASVVQRLTGGLKMLAKQRKVEVVNGEGRFQSANSIVVATDDGDVTISFDHCIIAAGSRVTKIPSFPHDDPRVMDSTDALELEEVPKRMLVIGGGIIGLEMATVYEALGSKITIVEMLDQLIPGADADIIRPLSKRLKARYENIYLKTSVTGIEAQNKGLKVSFDGKDAPDSDTFDRILVAVGRSPNGGLLDADKAGVNVDERGFIAVDAQMRSNVSHIFAIGDIVGQPMLAHKATHEAKVAAEAISGMKAVFEPMTIPSVAYTDPEVAWMGLTEREAKEQGIEYEKGAFPWAASGRSLSIGRDDGMTKALFDKASGRIIGAGIVGPNAGELIAEAVLALEMGADMEDIGLTIHPHPTLSETLCFAAEMADGTITDLMPPRKRK